MLFNILSHFELKYKTAHRKQSTQRLSVQFFPQKLENWIQFSRMVFFVGIVIPIFLDAQWNG